MSVTSVLRTFPSDSKDIVEGKFCFKCWPHPLTFDASPVLWRFPVDVNDESALSSTIQIVGVVTLFVDSSRRTSHLELLVGKGFQDAWSVTPVKIKKFKVVEQGKKTNPMVQWNLGGNDWGATWEAKFEWPKNVWKIWYWVGRLIHHQSKPVWLILTFDRSTNIQMNICWKQLGLVVICEFF